MTAHVYVPASSIFTKNHVYYGMDSSLKPSYICRLDRSNKKLKKLSQVPGPVWYSKALQDGWMLFACSVEEGESVVDNYARIFATKDGINLHNVFQVEKDNWPYLFKLGVISFATGEQDISVVINVLCWPLTRLSRALLRACLVHTMPR